LPAGTGSRIFSLKSALRAALAQVGTDEANFGLMSFPQTTTNTFDNSTCSTGHYRSTAARTNVMTPNRGSTSYNDGCLMSSNSIETTFGPWFDTGAAEVLRVGVTTAPPGVAPTAANFDPVDANIPAIYRWLDNRETPTANGAVTDPELHAAGFTPLGRSLFYAKVYYDGEVKPNDPKSSCRKNVVVLVTDGADTCDEATAPSPTMFNLTTCTGGPAFNPFHPVVQACQAFRNSGIKTYMITDSSLPAQNLTDADRIAAAGGTVSAIQVSLTNANAAKAAVVGIIAETVPPAETCNGLDDNCNGQIDEGVKNMCPLDLTGTLKHCAVEKANCLDDDCDGLIDEGFPLNACGKGAGCPIPPEVCDGIDNDCDGDVDEGFNVGAACNNGLTGTCRRVGIYECAPDKMGVTCNLTGAPIATEVCNNIDDDCNGMIDDGLGIGQGVGVDCGIQGQGCNKGITKCVAGKIICDSSAQPSTEICNGKDDDCNGLIDDGVFPGVGDSCLCPGLTQAQVDSGGLCRAGKKVCKGVLGVVCDGCVLPRPEICNGKDDDCDGVGDNMAMCPTGFGCMEGSCGMLCRGGEFTCPPGYDCVADYCVPNRCKNVQCPADKHCDTATGNCVDMCFNVTCQPGQTCMGGACLDCSNSPLLACAAGQTCVGRKCVEDKCYNVKCGDSEYCSNGSCVRLACSPECGTAEKCVAGKCVPFKCTQSCADVVEFCDYDTGLCTPNMCAAKTCPFCIQATGECTPDPCATVHCPDNGCWTCERTPSGTATCNPSAACGMVRTLAASKGGGCACDV
ncbi:MAG: MopE-related protein, partial [Myxococcales bacterium]